MLSKTEHELSRRMRPNSERDDPKRVNERTKKDDSTVTESRINVEDSRRLIPNRDNNESKRAEHCDGNDDSE